MPSLLGVVRAFGRYSSSSESLLSKLFPRTVPSPVVRGGDDLDTTRRRSFNDFRPILPSSLLTAYQGSVARRKVGSASASLQVGAAASGASARGRC